MQDGMLPPPDVDPSSLNGLVIRGPTGLAPQLGKVICGGAEHPGSAPTSCMPLPGPSKPRDKQGPVHGSKYNRAVWHCRKLTHA